MLINKCNLSQSLIALIVYSGVRTWQMAWLAHAFLKWKKKQEITLINAADKKLTQLWLGNSFTQIPNAAPTHDDDQNFQKHQKYSTVKDSDSVLWKVFRAPMDLWYSKTIETHNWKSEQKVPRILYNLNKLI